MMRPSARLLALFAVIGCLGSMAAASCALAPAAYAGEQPEVIQKKFESFARGWMTKLREREKFNVTKITWRRSKDGVEGRYVGYDTANYRILPLSNLDEIPIGKLVYLELEFRLAGKDEKDARGGGPQIVERVEVTELFRYHRGKWVY